MVKISLLFILLVFTFGKLESQDRGDFAVGIRVQKTQKLYWENGLGLDYTSDFLLQKKVHLKVAFVSSRLGSAMGSNAIKQENYLIGADWRFRHYKKFQQFVGVNTGFFHADMEEEIFKILPHNSMMFSIEGGVSYKFKFPLTAALSAGYNLISGNGVKHPGTLFPVFYQGSLYYYL